MASYTLQLTPALVNMATEGSMDESIVDGVSIQRTGYIEVWSGDTRKVIEVADGGTFDDSTFDTGLSVLPAE